MKVSILSESPADEAAAKLLIEALLHRPIEVIQPKRVPPGGYGAIPGLIPVQLKHLYYQSDDVEALVVWADSDDSTPHASHPVDLEHPTCRFCVLSRIIRATLATLTRRQERTPIKAAVALAVPEVEAWYRCGQDVHATEANYTRFFAEGHGLVQVRRQLKREVYGTDRPTLALETTRATAEATRLAQDLTLLRARFPGFSLFAEQVERW